MRCVTKTFSKTTPNGFDATVLSIKGQAYEIGRACAEDITAGISTPASFPWLTEIGPISLTVAVVYRTWETLGKPNRPNLWAARRASPLRLADSGRPQSVMLVIFINSELVILKQIVKYQGLYTWKKPSRPAASPSPLVIHVLINKANIYVIFVDILLK